MLPSAVRAAVANFCDMGVATYAANSTFEANLDRLGAELPANVSAAPTTGYAVATVGAAPDLVYALALCRGDVNASACGACVAAAFVDGKRNCPGIKGATFSRDGCVFRYSGQRFVDFLSTEQWQVSEILGYMAPEYLTRGNYSVKSDVFSFGVMVLEIVTGRKNNHSYNSQQSEDLLTMIWEQWVAGTVLEMVDPSMNSFFSESDVMRCIHIGLLCVQGDPADRPVMSSVVMMLGTDTVELHAPAKPTFFARKGSDESGVASGMSIVSLEEQS